MFIGEWVEPSAFCKREGRRVGLGVATLQLDAGRWLKAGRWEANSSVRLWPQQRSQS